MADISLQGITKAYGATVALDDISLEVAGGELLVLLGPSGSRQEVAGKVTDVALAASVADLRLFDTDSGHRLVWVPDHDDDQARPAAVASDVR